MVDIQLLVLRAVRFFGFALAIVATFSVFLAAWPLTWINPLLRAFGVPHRLLPSNVLTRLGSDLVLWVGGIRYRVTANSSKAGKKLLHDGTCVVMYSHSSNFDPIIMFSVVPCTAKHVYKKELGRIPIFGWVLYLYGHVSVDRKNRERAVHALADGVAACVDRGLNLAIAPEGTRSRTGEFQPFKRGPFHAAVSAKRPAVPVVIRGAFDLLPPKTKLFDAGTVDVTVLDPISGTDVDELQAAVRSSMESYIDQCKVREAATAEQRKADCLARNRSITTAVPAIVFLASAVLLSRFAVL